MVLAELDWYIEKNESRPPTYTIHQNKLKMYKRQILSCDTIKKFEQKPLAGKFQTSHIAIFLPIYFLGQGN